MEVVAMVKKIFLIISFFLPLLVPNSFAEEIIRVKGEVTFGNYKKGHIAIMVRKEKDAPPIYTKRIPRPGKYIIDLPKNLGLMYITAANLQEGAKGITKRDPRGEFSGNPIHIADKGIAGVNIEIIQPKAQHHLMNTYSGPTVNVSGRVIFGQYKEGEITIFARSEGFNNKEEVDISVARISSPGHYTIRVPKDYGKMKIGAVNVIKGKVSSKGNYANNPITIGSIDLKGIDIHIK